MPPLPPAALDILERALRDGLGAQADETGELRAEVRELRAAIDRLTAAHAERVTTERMTLYAVLVRRVDSAMDREPKATLVLLALLLAILVGGIYAITWHTEPATILRDLITVVRTLGAQP
jgi:hypothetical protein